ncbi:MAG TPA: Smr/MutS family protein [Rhizomicrobium sp.]|nr:Smr/MutS family protein [Rhizomicrobium sp.]
MAKRRTTTDEERRLFEQDFRQAHPLKVTMSTAAPRKKGASHGPAGVNGATEDRLRRGLIEPEARIDLHGMTQGVAHRALFAWLTTAHARGHRLVLVVTGKGNPKNDENAPWMLSEHGVLKQMVPRWLNEPELAALIAYTRPAHLKHGGDGALYVYLRKRS